MNYYYVYVLHSLKDHKFYVGYTSNLQKRLDDHKNGLVRSTKYRLPVDLIYWEGCLNQHDATRREKYLKSTWGKRYLKQRLKEYFHISQG